MFGPASTMHPRVEFTEDEYDAHMTNMERLVAVALDGRGSGWDKAATTPSTSGWMSLADKAGWQVFSSKQSDARGDHEYVCFGSIPSSLACIQQAHYVRNTTEFQRLNAVVYEDMYVDAAVLNITHGRSEEDPGQFFGVKYVKIKVPVLNENDQPQTYLYIECSGTRVDSHGRLTFFVATDPVSVHPASAGIAIPRGALCASITLYRDSVGGHGGVDVVMRTTFDAATCRPIPSQQSDHEQLHHHHGGGRGVGGSGRSTAARTKEPASHVTLWKSMALFIPSALTKDLFGLVKLATLPESRRLATGPLVTPKDLCNKCCVCFKGFNLLRRRSHCRRCALAMCTGCAIRLYCGGTSPAAGPTPEKFCTPCLFQAKVDAMNQVPTPQDYNLDRHGADRCRLVVHLQNPRTTGDTGSFAEPHRNSRTVRPSTSGSDSSLGQAQQHGSQATAPTALTTATHPSSSRRATFDDLTDSLPREVPNAGKRDAIQTADSRQGAVDEAAWTNWVRELALVRLGGVVVDGPLLGSGDATVVRLGTYKGQCVAVKSLLPGANVVLLRQFVGEIQLLRQFDSQFIIKALGASWGDQGHLDEVVEFMDGGTLATALATPDSLLWPDKLATLQRVVEGLMYLHSYQVVHRDLKAKSVLLDSRHGAKLGGFGRARDYDADVDDDDDTPAVTALDSAWLAPEVASGDPHTWESDIYALGVIVVEMAAHAARMCLSVDKTPLDVLSRLQNTCPSWLFDLTCQCLSARPTDRPTACALSHTFHQKFQPSPSSGGPDKSSSSSSETKPTVQSGFRMAESHLSASHETSAEPANATTTSSTSRTATNTSSSTQPKTNSLSECHSTSSASSSTNPLTSTSTGAAFDGVARLDETQLALVSRLGSGAFGDVWLATYQGERVAVKKMHPHMVTTDQVRGFLAEISLMSQFDSPYIVNVLGASWTTLSDVQCVMELMDGGDLGDRLAATTPDTFSWSAKLAILVNVIEALCDVHDINIIHRDLKSRNVLLDSIKPAKLTDFGISKENLEQTMTNGMGTCRWMAPEVIEGNQYTVSADIYSFGMILSEMDRHEIPFKSAKNKNGTAMLDTQIMLGVVSGKLKPTFSDDCPDWVKKMALECVATDPDNRPPAYKLSHALRTIQRRMAMP